MSYHKCVAYFTAYWLKGNDQRINKVDLLDVDLHTQQVYGNTWFSIFSPRIQNYIVGLKPADALGGANPAVPASVTMSWMGRPETGWGGTGRARSQGGLFRRAYDYAPEATGMIRVPIQVWATKNFVTSWNVPFDPAKPIVAADLKHPRGNPDAITGSITSNFPIPLAPFTRFAAARGAGIPWKTCCPACRSVWQSCGRQRQEMENWLTDMPNARLRPSAAERTAPPGAAQRADVPAPAQNGPTTCCETLDESWRLTHKDKAILYARIPADGVRSFDGQPRAQPLWLGGCPDRGGRPSMLGSMSQATFPHLRSRATG